MLLQRNKDTLRCCSLSVGVQEHHCKQMMTNAPIVCAFKLPFYTMLIGQRSLTKKNYQDRIEIVAIPAEEGGRRSFPPVDPAEPRPT